MDRAAVKHVYVVLIEGTTRAARVDGASYPKITVGLTRRFARARIFLLNL
jgi:hypothetical protein